jgi:hypothetical protein
MYFFFVETKNKTLEELDAIFEATNPRKASVIAMKVSDRAQPENAVMSPLQFFGPLMLAT